MLKIGDIYLNPASISQIEVGAVKRNGDHEAQVKVYLNVIEETKPGFWAKLFGLGGRTRSKVIEFSGKEAKALRQWAEAGSQDIVKEYEDWLGKQYDAAIAQSAKSLHAPATVETKPRTKRKTTATS